MGTLPSGPEAQSKVKSLPYATLAEAIAEKFHCDLGFLKKLNAGKAEHLEAENKVLVPNVKPFEIAEVKALKPGAEATAAAGNENDQPLRRHPTRPTHLRAMLNTTRKRSPAEAKGEQAKRSRRPRSRSTSAWPRAC